MSDCLVTKLNGIVQDENLPIFGKMRFAVVCQGKANVPFGSMNYSRVTYNTFGSPTTYSVNNGAYFTEQGSQTSVGSSITLRPSDGKAYDLYVPNGSTVVTCDKYTSYELINVSSIIDDMNDADGITFIEVPPSLNKRLKTEWFKNAKLTEIYLPNNSIEGSIENFESASTMRVLHVYGNPLVTGRLSDVFDAWASAGKNTDLNLIIGGDSMTLDRGLENLNTWTGHVIHFENNSWSIVS